MIKTNKKYPNINNKKTSINKYILSEKNFDEERLEKQMLAELICNVIKTDNMVEFANVKYIDEELLTPTIAEAYINMGNTATIITSNTIELKNEKLTIINTMSNNPYGEFQRLITPSMINKINEAKCFVTTKDLPKLDKYFKTWAGMGIPCVYCVSGSLDKIIKQKDDAIREYMKSLTKDNQLTLESDFSYDKNMNKLAKIYVLKR